MRRTVILQRVMVARQLLPRDVYFWLKALTLALISVQAARLLWTVATPLGPIGRWLPPAPAIIPEAAQLALLTTIDPFASAAISAPVTASATKGLTLFGTRMPSSAIIAGVDGIQVSYSVGEEVAPGVRLSSVGFDSVILGGNGSEQRLTLEGAEPESSNGPAAISPAAGSAANSSSLTPENIRANVAFAPRSANGRITGLLVSPLGDPALLRAAGLRDGDIITEVNGRPITDPASLLSQLSPGARLSLTVERGADSVPVALLLEGNR